MRFASVLAAMFGLLVGTAAPAVEGAPPAVDPDSLAVFMAKWSSYQPFKGPQGAADRPWLLAALRRDPAGPWFAYLYMQTATAERDSTTAGLIPVLREADAILAEAALAGAGDADLPIKQRMLQSVLAEFLLGAGASHLAEVRAIGERILERYREPGQADYGDAVYDANHLLGRVALREGRVQAARDHLRAAGRSPGSPTLDTFGPDFGLAGELLAHGEPADREAVLAFLDDIAGFWVKPDEETNGVYRDLNLKKRDDLEKWKALIRGGGIPDFARLR